MCIHHDLPSRHAVDSFYDLLRHTIYPLLAKTPLHLTWVKYFIIHSSLGIFCFNSVWSPKTSAKHDWGKISEKYNIINKNVYRNYTTCKIDWLFLIMCTTYHIPNYYWLIITWICYSIIFSK